MYEPENTPLAVSVIEAAKMIGVGRTSMFALIADGSVASKRVRGRRLILVSSLQQLVGAGNHDDHRN